MSDTYVRFRDRRKSENERSTPATAATPATDTTSQVPRHQPTSASVAAVAAVAGGYPSDFIFEVQPEAPAVATVAEPIAREDRVRHRLNGSQLLLKPASAPDRAAHTLHLDFETRSAADLPGVGVHVYAADPTTRMLLISYAVDSGPFETWRPGMPIPGPILEASRNPAWTVVSHNVEFEKTIWKNVLEPQGWPEIPLSRWRCTMVASRVAGLPARLEGAANALSLVNRKDTRGRGLIKFFCVPKNKGAVKALGEAPIFNEPEDHPEKFEEFVEYNRQDVACERELDGCIPPLPDTERPVWELHVQINELGMGIDRHLAAMARKVAKDAVAELNAELEEITGGAVTAATQYPSLKKWLVAQGYSEDDVKSLGTDEIKNLLEVAVPSNAAHRALEICLEASKASPRKIDKMLAWSAIDGRARGTLNYYGASQTGRFSGAGYQPQNMRRPVLLETTESIADAIVAVGTGDLQKVKALHHDPISIISDLIRSIIIAAPGHRLISVDLSMIEARLLAFECGEEWKLQEFRNYDDDPRPANDPDKYPDIYKVTAAKILKINDPKDVTKQQRGRIGKVAELAGGYGGSVGSFRSFQKREDRKLHTDEQVKEFITAWREENSNIRKTWYAWNDAAIDAVRDPKQGTEHRGIKFRVVDDVLLLTLLSGRDLRYPSPVIKKDRFGKDAVFYTEHGHKKATAMYGGKWAAHITQAHARDLLTGAMLRVAAAGYRIVLHAHDEIIAEMPNGTGSIEEMRGLMIELPDWAKGLPIDASGWEGERYRKD